MSTKESIPLIIDSRNRVSGTNTNFTVNINSNIDRIKKLVIDKVYVPFSFYVFNSTNNVLAFNGGAQSITITAGNYTGSSLITELVAQLNIVFAGSSPSVVFSSTTLKLTISMTTSFIVNSVSSVPTSTAATMLGFQSNSVSGTSATADSVLNITGPTYLTITSAYLAKLLQNPLRISNTYTSNIIWSLAIEDQSFGDVIIETPNMELQLSIKTVIQTTDAIDFTLYDDLGNIVNLNGAEWYIRFVLITE